MLSSVSFSVAWEMKIRVPMPIAATIVRLTAIVIFLDKSVLMTSLSEATFVAVLLLLLKILRT